MPEWQLEKAELPELSFDEIRAAIAAIAQAEGVHCGMPLPIEDVDSWYGMTIHPSFYFADRLKGNKKVDPEDANLEVANMWWSQRERAYVTIAHETIKDAEGKRIGSRYKKWGLFAKRPIDLLMRTGGALQVWDINAEMKALETLKEHVTEHQYNSYFMAGMFLETSKKSNIIYVFRRLRPTIAISFAAGHGEILCSLCMHPIGYYDDSFAGAMVPTDDVLAHLLLMRGDEHRYWRDCEQHEPWMPESGIST